MTFLIRLVRRLCTLALGLGGVYLIFKAYALRVSGGSLDMSGTDGAVLFVVIFSGLVVLFLRNE